MAGDPRIQLIHPDGKAAPRIDRAKYDQVAAAILAALADEADGVAFTSLAARVAALLPQHALATLGSVGWYTTAVKLDLQARGIIERVPGVQPQRLRCVKSDHTPLTADATPR